MAFGVTDQGFIIPQLTDIQAEINQTLLSTFGANIDLSANSVFGQLSGVFSEREYLVWAAMQDVYNSQYPDTSFGASLDNVGAISGIPRLSALPSTLQGVKLFGISGTLVPGTTTQFSVQGSPNNIFSLDADATLGVGASCIQTLSFSLVPTAGQWKIASNGHDTSFLAFNANAAAVQVAIRLLPFCSGCVVTGNYTSGFTVTFVGAGTGGFMVQPQFQVVSNTLVNGMTVITLTPLITVPGLDQASVNVTAVSTGPTLANAGTLINIVTPISGLNAVLNITDAVIGRNVESDNAYRARRALTLQIAGAGTFEAIRSRLLSLTGVTAAILFENVTLIDDPDGRPPKSFESIVQGGDDQAIADLLWQIKPAGILTDGSITKTITDSQGQTHEINFSRPTDLLIYIEIDLSVDAEYPLSGDAAVIQALVDSGNSLGIGTNVIVIPKLIASIASIPGIQDAVLKVGLAPSPTLSDNIVVAPNQIAIFDTSRVSVNHV